MPSQDKKITLQSVQKILSHLFQAISSPSPEKQTLFWLFSFLSSGASYKENIMCILLCVKSLSLRVFLKFVFLSTSVIHSSLLMSKLLRISLLILILVVRLFPVLGVLWINLLWALLYKSLWTNAFIFHR